MSTDFTIAPVRNSPAAPLASLLQQLGAVVARLDDGQYRREHARGVSGSIGSHVRHCLDHVAALLQGLQGDEIDYDSRTRGTAVESTREAALAEICRLALGLGGISANALPRPVTLPTLLDAEGAVLEVDSTVGRELAFVLSHTVHHFAVIAFLLRDLGVSIPPRFGHAPATLAARAARCA